LVCRVCEIQPGRFASHRAQNYRGEFAVRGPRYIARFCGISPGLPLSSVRYTTRLDRSDPTMRSQRDMRQSSLPRVQPDMLARQQSLFLESGTTAVTVQGTRPDFRATLVTIDSRARRAWLIDLRCQGFPSLLSSVPPDNFARDPGGYSEDHRETRNVDQRPIPCPNVSAA
jgi:hypothetical protein